MNESTVKNPAIDIDIVKSAAIMDGNNNIHTRRYSRLLNKQWHFFQQRDKLSWIQQIELDNLQNLAIKILTYLAFMESHPLNILFAVRTLNLPFKSSKKDQAYIGNQIDKTTQTWRCNFVKQLLEDGMNIINNNYWLYVILTQHKNQKRYFKHR